MAIEKALALIALKRTEQIGDISDAVEAAQAAQAAAELAQGKAEDAQEAAEAAMANKADTNGYYANMTVGNAEQLISDDYVTEKVPYNFRTAGGDADIGNREYDELVGGTIAWNQLMYDGNFTDVGNWNVTNGTAAVADNILTATCTHETETTNFYITQKNIVRFASYKDHKYFICIDAKFSKDNSSGCKLRLQQTTSPAEYMTGTATITNIVADTWYHFAVICNAERADNKTQIVFWPQTISYVAGDTIELKNCMVIDLTQMFGTAIADHIYVLETANAGDGVAWFTKLFPKDYYAYNSGTLMSVNAASHDTVGFNALDLNNLQAVQTTQIETITNIPVVGGQKYRLEFQTVWSGNKYVREYDAAGNMLKQTNMYGSNSAQNITMQPTTVSVWLQFAGKDLATIKSYLPCLHLVWSGYRNGEYEAYDKHSYPLDSDLTLLGVPTLDASNNLVYDGDIYAADGTVTRRYASVDLGTLTWNYSATAEHEVFYCSLSSIKPVPTENDKGQMLCMEYTTESQRNVYMQQSDKIISTSPANNNPHRLWIYDSAKMTMTTAEFKTAMSGVQLVYELAEPTTETADPYQSPQIVSDFGTEEYVDYAVSQGTRDVAIPVGHNTKYIANLVDKLRRLPNPPDSAGNYLVHYDSTTRRTSYTAYIGPIELPDAPAADGTYTLKATVADGEATYTWEAQS